MSLDKVRALALARRLIDDALREAVQDCLAAGIDRSVLANELGIDRSTLYRRHPAARRLTRAPRIAGEELSDEEA